MYCSRCGTWTPDSANACERCGEPLVPAASVVPAIEVVAAPPAQAVRYAGFWRRFAAMFVDGLLLFFPDAIMRVNLGLPTAFTMQPPRSDLTPALVLALVLSTAAWWLYCALLESSRWQGTLGQQLLGMRVCDRGGRRISFARATARYFAQWLSVLLCGLGYLFNLWTARRQTLHDLVAGCLLQVPARDDVPVAGAATVQPS